MCFLHFATARLLKHVRILQLAQAEEWPALLQALRDGRPDLDVAWRAADPGEQGAQRP